MKIATILLLSSLSGTALADTTLTYTDQNDKTVMKMQFSGNTIKATSVSNDSGYMIYDANKKTFTTLMTDKKKYLVMGQKEIDALGNTQALVQSILDKQLAGMPAAQRDMMKNLLASTIKAKLPKKMPKPVYQLTDKTASYNDIDCKVVTKKSQKKTSEFCVSSYASLGMKANEYAAIASFQKTVEKLASQYGADKSMDFSSLGEFIPVRYSQNGTTGTLKSVNHDKLESNTFTIPKGYTKMQIPF